MKYFVFLNNNFIYNINNMINPNTSNDNDINHIIYKILFTELNKSDDGCNLISIYSNLAYTQRFDNDATIVQIKCNNKSECDFSFITHKLYFYILTF